MQDIFGSTLIEQTNSVKSRFIKVYMILTMGALAFFSILFNFFIINKTVSIYLFIVLILFSFFYYFSTYKYYPDKYVKVYLIIGPLLNMYILATFWENSIAGFVTLFPVIFAAYIFFNQKITIYFSFYIILICFCCYFIHEELEDLPRYHRNQVVMTDAFLFTYNVCVLFLLFVLKERLDTIKLSAKDNPDDNRTYRGGKKEVRNIEAEIDHEQAHQLITRLRNLMEIDKLYKDPDIEISKIGLELGVSYSYLSKVIRLKGFNNFNHYINTYRINYVKKLLQESDLEKMTLMYIYSEAGFKNQSTFNRAFKQIEGVTPSEYIKSRFK